MRYIDLRSDSVTQPTKQMRKAMYEAEVGYDVFRDDPTVNRLEKIAAEMTGMEAGLFVATGTMSNQIAIMTFTNRGDEIILSYDSHILEFEVGAASALSSVGYRPIYSPDSILRRSDIIKAIRPYKDDIHVPRTGLVCLENALGRGSVVSLEQMKEAYITAKENNIPVHTDGARVFNAAVALGVDIQEIAKYTDSLAIHLSKGLCAPVGAVLLGTKDFIEKARKNRHMIGGGMSHPGILAAAGIVALESMVERLSVDHANARYMRKRLMEFPGIDIDNTRNDINLVFFKISDVPQSFIENLPQSMMEHGIKISAGSNGMFRFVLHNDVSREDVDYTIKVFDMIYSRIK